MSNYKLIAEPIISDFVLTNIPNNYILYGSINELTKTNDNKDMYLLIVNRENRHIDDITYLTNIASVFIKYLRENYDIRNIQSFYYKYNGDLCKFTILECNDDKIKYKLVLKLI